jgi:ATP-dependent DNA helicase RecQ
MTVTLPIQRSNPGSPATGQRRSRRSIDNRQSTIGNLAASLFGVIEFRSLQREAIEASLAGQDSLVIMATGSGKSLCYQLPAVAESGLTLVVSPLIALMDDQIMALKSRGIAADCIHSGDHWRINDEKVRAAKDGRLRLLYVSPERCDDLAFLPVLMQCELRSFVIDEAHCISIWGPDFRPAYAKLGQLRVMFPHVPVAAFTATATPRVREQIKESLMLRKPVELIGDFDRPTLTLRVVFRDPRDPDAHLVKVIRSIPSSLRPSVPSAVDGIVYCPTRAETERVAAMLSAYGLSARPYHAGLSSEERRAVHEWFIAPDSAPCPSPAIHGGRNSPGVNAGALVRDQRSRIVVATIAFGMGIDKLDVRFVVHHGMPSSLDVYHQEIGRAGRDGKPAECVLLYSPDDYQRWIGIFQSQAPDSPAMDGKLDALSDMEAFCGVRRRSQSLPLCRHAHLVEYFGQEHRPPPVDPSRARKEADNGCGACDVCLGVA